MKYVVINRHRVVWNHKHPEDLQPQFPSKEASMADYVTLLGVESVQSAGYTMRDAALNMSRAAGAFDDALRRHQLFMDNWLNRFEAIMEAKYATSTDNS